jgi:DNA-binding CsgD family transcriptional regulator
MTTNGDDPINPITFNLGERRVLALIGDGRSSKKMAPRLEISTSRVNARIAAICRKAKVDDRPELQAWLYQNPHAAERGVSSVPGGLRAPFAEALGLD